MLIVVTSFVFLFVLMLLGVDWVVVDGDGDDMRLNNNWVSVGLIRGVKTFPHASVT
jgi:hypothetical protein